MLKTTLVALSVPIALLGIAFHTTGALFSGATVPEQDDMASIEDASLLLQTEDASSLLQTQVGLTDRLSSKLSPHRAGTDTQVVSEHKSNDILFVAIAACLALCCMICFSYIGSYLYPEQIEGKATLGPGSASTSGDGSERVDLTVEQKDIHEQAPSNDSNQGIYHTLLGMWNAFGGRFLVMMVFGQILLCGFSQQLCNTATPYVYAEYGTSSVLVSVYSTIKLLPYACRFLIGVTFNMCPIRGYHYLPFMLVASILGIASYICIALLQPTMVSALGFTIMLFFARLQEATVDIGITSRIATNYKKNPALGPALSVFSNGCMMFSAYLAAGLFGIVAQDVPGVKGDPRVVFAVCATLACLVLPLVYFNFHGEEKVSSEKAAEIRQQLLADKELFVLGIVVCSLAVLLSISQLLITTAYLRLISSIIVLALAALGLNMVFGPEIAKPQTYELIASACAPSVSAASFYFYTDTVEEYSAGPHFGPLFYNGALSIIGGLFTILGLAVFMKYLYIWKFRHISMLYPVMLAIVRIPDMIIFSRLNVSWGISDHVFVIGGEPLSFFVKIWPMMMTSILVCKCSPAGLEATVVAILTSYANFSGVVSDCLGAFVLEVSGVNPSGAPNENEQFARLSQVTLVAMIIPLFPLFLLPYLMPNAKLTDEFLVTNKESPTAGSWLNRWRGTSEVKESPFW